MSGIKMLVKGRWPHLKTLKMKNTALLSNWSGELWRANLPQLELLEVSHCPHFCRYTSQEEIKGG